MKVASLKVIHARNPSFLGTQYTKIKSARKICTRTPWTNLIIELYKYQAESERKRIIERQQQGIALAKQQGKYHGRKAQYTKDDPRLLHAFKLYQAGMSDADIARTTGIKRTTFIRYRKKYKIKRK